MKHARLRPALALAVLFTSPTLAQTPGRVLAEGRLDFAGPLSPGDEFGRAVCALGDVDGDGIGDLAVGAPGDDMDAPGAGAVWVLFLDAAGDVRDAAKIGAATGLGRAPEPLLRFGESLEGLGDLDGDGTPDLAVSAPGTWFPLTSECSLLFLHPDGTLKARAGVTRAALGSTSRNGFGQGLAALNLDGTGPPELVVTDPLPYSSNPILDVHTVFLTPTGAVASSLAAHTSSPSFYPGLGRSAANVGDRNGDGIPDLAVGEPYEYFPGFGELVGQLWLFFMSPDGSAPSSVRIGRAMGGFGGLLGEDDKFGLQVTELADLDGNGVTDLAVAANDAWAYPAGFAAGVVWLLFMEPDGTVGSELLLAPGQNGFSGPLGTRDHFGEGLAWTDHGAGTGAGTLWVGSHGDDTAANEAGAVWRLTIDGVSAPPAVVVRNGTHVNPVVLRSTSLPRVDANWNAEVDAFAFPATTTTYLVGYEDPALVPLAFGELLVLIEPSGVNVFVDAAPVVAGVAQHALPIPDDLAFVGREVHVQGLLAGGGLRLTNALQLTIGAP